MPRKPELLFMHKTIFISTVFVSTGVLLGRIAGFFREMAMANIFGVSAEADVAIFLLTLPDFLVSMLVAGALSVALIPEFKKFSKQQASSLFIQVSLIAVAAFSALVTLLIYFSEAVVTLFAPGFEGETANIAADKIHIVLWLIPITVLAGISTAFLQSRKRFFMPAMGTLIFNSCIVSGLLLFATDVNVLSYFVWFIVFAGLVRWWSQLWALKNDIVLDKIWSKVLVSRILFQRYYQAVIALGLLSLFPVIVRVFSTTQGEGSLAMANYALRLVELPMGVIVGVFSVVLFPHLVGFYKDKNETEFSAVLTKGLFWAVACAVSIMSVIIINSETIVALVYGWGEMSENNLSNIALLLMVSVLSLPFQATTIMLISAFNAQNDTKTPIKLGFFAVSFLLFSCWYGGETLGLKGIVLAFVLSHLFMFIGLLLTFKLSKKNDRFDIDLGITGFILPVIIAFIISMAGSYSVTLLNISEFIQLVLGLCFVVISWLSVDKLFPRYRLHHFW